MATRPGSREPALLVGTRVLPALAVLQFYRLKALQTDGEEF